MTTTRKVTFLAAEYSPYVRYGLSYTLVSPKWEAYHHPLGCKDYLQDIFLAERVKPANAVAPAGHTPGCAGLAPDRPRYRVALRHTDMPANLAHIKRLVAGWERRLRFKRTRFMLSSGPTVVVANFSREWAEQPIRLSLLMTLFRVGPDYPPDGTPLESLRTLSTKPNLHDRYNLQYALPKLARIWEVRGFPFTQTWEQYAGSGGGIHSYSGIAGFKPTAAELGVPQVPRIATV